jgi:hypothetical protein
MRMMAHATHQEQAMNSGIPCDGPVMDAMRRAARALRSSWWPTALLAVGMQIHPAVQAEVIEGNGKAASETRATAAFEAIRLHGGITLQLRQGSPASVVVHADSNLLPLIGSSIEGDRTLHLRWQRGTSVRIRARTWVEVTAPQIHAVSSLGSGDINIDSMKVPRLDVSIQGSGDLQAQALDTDELTLSMAGSGDLSAAGRSTRLRIDVSGSGNADASSLRAEDVTVGIAGSGGASVHATRTLAASIAGSGNVTYSGEPTVQRAIAGSGSVSKR